MGEETGSIGSLASALLYYFLMRPVPIRSAAAVTEG